MIKGSKQDHNVKGVFSSQKLPIIFWSQVPCSNYMGTHSLSATVIIQSNTENITIYFFTGKWEKKCQHFKAHYWEINTLFNKPAKLSADLVTDPLPSDETLSLDETLKNKQQMNYKLPKLYVIYGYNLAQTK